MCKMIVSPSNPVREQPPEVNLDFHDIPVKRGQLQTRLKQATNGCPRYKRAYVQKKLRKGNKAKRVDWGSYIKTRQYGVSGDLYTGRASFISTLLLNP